MIKHAKTEQKRSNITKNVIRTHDTEQGKQSSASKSSETRRLIATVTPDSNVVLPALGVPMGKYSGLYFKWHK